MKASRLISRLQDLIEKAGDLELAFFEEEFATYCMVRRVYFRAPAVPVDWRKEASIDLLKKPDKRTEPFFELVFF